MAAPVEETATGGSGRSGVKSGLESLSAEVVADVHRLMLTLREQPEWSGGRTERGRDRDMRCNRELLFPPEIRQQSKDCPLASYDY